MMDRYIQALQDYARNHELDFGDVESILTEYSA